MKSQLYDEYAQKLDLDELLNLTGVEGLWFHPENQEPANEYHVRSTDEVHQCLKHFAEAVPSFF